MNWLNYQHLYYFWSVVRAGSITKACRELRLAPPTVSAQLRRLEEQLGEKLLTRSGRGLVPTEAGRTVFRYADEIFALGRELVDAVNARPTSRPLRLVVGVDDVLPKEIAHRLIEPALHLDVPVRLLCREAGLDRLLSALVAHELDVVLSDAPATPSLDFQAYNHHLGDCGVSFVAAPELARRYRRGFPQSLRGAPLLLPTDDTNIRRDLDQWLEERNIRPLLVGEFEDYALLCVFGQASAGLFPVPSVLEKQFQLQYGIQRVGRVKGVRGHFYAISGERRLKHPAVVAIREAARGELFR
jgi:LysR family transcriptional activator of nhaA